MGDATHQQLRFKQRLARNRPQNANLRGYRLPSTNYSNKENEPSPAAGMRDPKRRATTKPILCDISHYQPPEDPIPLAPVVAAPNELVLAEKLRANHLYTLFQSERAKRTHTEAEKEDLESEIAQMQSELSRCKESTSVFVQNLETRLFFKQRELDKVNQQLIDERKRNDKLTKEKQALAKRASRFAPRLETARQKAAEKVSSRALKEKCVVRTGIRQCIRDMVSLNVPVENVATVINAVTTAFNISVSDTVSTSTVRHIVIEGDIAADVQMVDAINNAPHHTLSQDGTGVKNRQYESRHITTRDPITNEMKTFFLGLSTAPNHTSATQLDGWKSRINEMYATYNSSPLGKKEPLDPRTFYLKAAGMLSDHANDQKLLVALFRKLKERTDLEIRGEQSAQRAPPAEVLIKILQLNEERIAEVGGQEAWDALNEAEKARRNDELRTKLILDYGRAEYDKLTPEQKFRTSLFIEGGCMMHKELNCLKGGVEKGQKYWADHNKTPPFLHLNKDNAAIAELGGAAKAHAENVSMGGAIKTTSAMGLALSHHDPKKGHQDKHGMYFLIREHIGFFVRYPQTSSNRYLSHAIAAGETIVHLPVYRELFEFLRDLKDSMEFNNLESNIYKALHDRPTLTELCAVALYSQGLSHPYLRAARGKDRNLLNFGPLHEKVLAYCKKISKDPSLLCGTAASYETGTLDGKPWERPEVVYSVLAMVQRGEILGEELEGLVRYVFEGAAVDWVKFSTEFRAHGTIARMTDEQKKDIYLPSTNCENESGCAIARVQQRRAPNATLDFTNGKIRYKRNGVAQYITERLADDESQAFLRSNARTRVGEKRSKKVRLEEAREAAKTAETHRVEKVGKDQRREERVKKVDGCEVELDLNKLDSLSVEAITLQLRWHRTRELEQPFFKNKSQVGPYSKLVKVEKLEMLKEAVKRWNEFRDSENWVDVEQTTSTARN